MFLLISGCHIGAPKKYTISNNRHIHKKLYKGANNSKTVGHKDRLGQIIYILVFYNFSFSWLLPQNGFQHILFVA